jgi:L,D-peptidoglycan transpeptidase YkuD (ErfK/YbiS/YcfS/YnhG family)
MALLTRLQWTLQRLCLAQVWAQSLFVVVSILAVLSWVLRQDSMEALAKDSEGNSSSIQFGTSPIAQWHTLYELDSLAAQAHANTEALLRANNKRQTKPSQSGKQSLNVLPNNGEALFLETYRLQTEGEYAQALQVAQSMAHRFANFQLGQLIYADLMASMSGAAPDRESLMQKPETLQRLHQLKTEALQRTRHAGTHALSGTYPEPVRFLSPSVKQVVVVDAQKSRLYLLAHKNDGPGLGRLHVLFDAYISIGNKGMGKWREGDAKTPTGVYFVQKHMNDFMLPDLYGSGALTLDYPNPLDKQQQRTGSGIWLHGSPSLQYARPPTATDGCVVLANDDMLQLVKLGVRAGTPVLIAEQLNWLDNPLSSGLVKSVSGTEALQARALQPQFIQQKTGNWTLVSAFEWTDQQRTVAVLSHELQTPGQPPQRRHSYWVKDQQQWKEVSGLL